jgi:polyisoprenoid-binding protein YceI
MSKTIWKIDPVHSEVTFKVKHMMISTITGHFNEFDATLTTDGDSLENASLEAEIEVASIDTKNEERDKHLKSDDFFNADAFPKITFNGSGISGAKMKGSLRIRETAKEIPLEAEISGPAVDPYGQTKAGVEIRGEINRKAFGLNWSAVTEAGNVVVSDTVKLIIDAQFIKL